MKKIGKKDLETLNPEYKVVTKIEPESVVAEAYRRIKVSLDFSSLDKKLKVIQIVSSIKGEGKSITLLNIAATYAENNKKVIVVDLDLRKPKCHRAFKVENKDGLNDVLLGSLKLKDAIKHSDELGFDLLNSGKIASTSIASVIESQSLKQVIEQLKDMYDIVLIDCPPILAVSDSIIISSFCDAAIFVLSQLKTEKRVAKEAVKILRNNNVNLVGTVFTEIKTKKGSKDSYYNYNYYYGYSKEDK